MNRYGTCESLILGWTKVRSHILVPAAASGSGKMNIRASVPVILKDGRPRLHHGESRVLLTFPKSPDSCFRRNNASMIRRAWRSVSMKR